MRPNRHMFSSLKLIGLISISLCLTACNDRINHCIYGLSEDVVNVSGTLCNGQFDVIYAFDEKGFWTNPETISTQCQDLVVEIEFTDGDVKPIAGLYISGLGEKSTEYDKYYVEDNDQHVRTHASRRSGLKTCPADELAKFEWAFDPHGLEQAENSGEQSRRLKACSDNENCPDHAEALFWMAATTLSEASSEVDDPGIGKVTFPAGTSAMSMGEALAIQFQAFVQENPMKYNLESPVFKRGLSLMHKARDAGSSYASNELGLLFMSQQGMQDLSLAKIYFDEALEVGDPNGAYNLARITRLETPNAHTEILHYLKLAAKSEEGNFQHIYYLGQDAFGGKKGKKTAAKFFKKNGEAHSSLVKEFEIDFGLTKSTEKHQ